MQAMNLKSGKQLATAFFEAGAKLASLAPADRANPEDGYIEKVLVGTTNIAFACELCMKLVLFKMGVDKKALRRHGLKDLYGMLRDSDQTAIEEMTRAFYVPLPGEAYGHDQFISDLEASSEAFVDIRYWHEVPDYGKAGKQARVMFLRSFGRALVIWMNQLVP